MSTTKRTTLVTAALIAVVAGVFPNFSFVTRKYLGGKKQYVMILLVAFLCEMAVYMTYNLKKSELVRGEKLCAVKLSLVIHITRSRTWCGEARTRP